MLTHDQHCHEHIFHVLDKNDTELAKDNVQKRAYAPLFGDVLTKYYRGLYLKKYILLRLQIK